MSRFSFTHFFLSGSHIPVTYPFNRLHRGRINYFKPFPSKQPSRSLNIPIIASGGAGEPKHVADALTKGEADAALAASIFHYEEYTVSAVKDYLEKRSVIVRK